MADITLTTTIPGVSDGKKVQMLPSPRIVEQIKLRIRWETIPTGITKIAIPTKITIQGSHDDLGVISGLAVPVNGDGAVIPAVLAVGSTPENVAFGAFPFRIGGVNKNKAANAVGEVFTAAHKIAANKYGAIAVNINAAGTINTQINSATQTDTLSYNDALSALQSVQSEAFTPTTDYIRIGYLLIQNNGVLWTAGTDDLSADITAVLFHDLTSSYQEIETYTFDSDDIARGKGTFFLTETKPNKYERIFVSEITGDAQLVIEADFVPVNAI